MLNLSIPFKNTGEYWFALIEIDIWIVFICPSSNHFFAG
jgi:hypothetical protein